MVLKITNRVQIGLLGVVVSLAALYFVAVQLNWQLFLEALTTARYGYLLPCMALLLAGLFTRALRWQVLLEGKIPLRRTFSIMNVAYLVNGILPLRLGEVARVYLVYRLRQQVPIPQTTSTIVVERIMDLLAVVLMVFLALMLGDVPEQLRLASQAGAVLAITGFIVLVLLASNRALAERLFAAVLQYVPLLRRVEQLPAWFAQFLDGLMPLTRSMAVLQTAGWTTVSWVLSVAAGYVLMFAFFDTGDLAATMLYIAAAAFAIALPAVPGNIGTYEASILLALTALGYDQSSTAIAFAVMVHAVNVFVHAATGVVGLMQEGISLGSLSQGIQQMQQKTELI